MRFFWLMTAVTVIAIYLNSSIGTMYQGIEVMVILLIITDLLLLWKYSESDKISNGKKVLLEKIENLEKLTSQMFDKVAKKFSNEKNDKKDLIESLNNF